MDPGEGEARREAVDLDALEQMLMSDSAPEFSMGLSELDGFLTGIAAGPGMPLPSEFLPVIWGGDGPGLESIDAVDPLVRTILHRLAEILTALAKGPDAFLPVYLEAEDVTDDAGDWADGFMQAIGLKLEDWDPLLKSKRDCVLLSPILMLATDAEGNSYLEEEDGVSEAALAEVADMIPVSAAAIHDFWRVWEAREERVLPRVREARPGRNEPCSCGSGKKFKRCCGG